MSEQDYYEPFKKAFEYAISKMGLENHKKMSVFGPSELDVMLYRASKRKAQECLKKAS